MFSGRQASHSPCLQNSSHWFHSAPHPAWPSLSPVTMGPWCAHCPPSPDLLLAVTLPVLIRVAGLRTSPVPSCQFSPSFRPLAVTFPKRDLGLLGGGRKARPSASRAPGLGMRNPSVALHNSPLPASFPLVCLAHLRSSCQASAALSHSLAGQPPLFLECGQKIVWPHILFRNVQFVSPRGSHS